METGESLPNTTMCYSGIRIFASDGFKLKNFMDGFYFSYYSCSTDIFASNLLGSKCGKYPYSTVPLHSGENKRFFADDLIGESETLESRTPERNEIYAVSQKGGERDAFS